MIRRRRSADAPAQGAPAWMTTFSGMLMQLLAFFIMLFAMSGAGERLQQAGSLTASSTGLPAEETDDSRNEATPLTALQERLGDELKGTALREHVQVVRGEKTLIIRFDAALLFESGRAVIKQEAIPALDAIGQVLATVSNPIRVEGHTDSDPVLPGAQYPDNWMLSGVRATGILRFLHEFHGIPFAQMAIAGYADTRPVASNETPDGKARNRRVDIVIFAR